MTIPKELREKIGIDIGSFIEIKETEMGYIIQKQIKESSLKKYIGILDAETSSDDVIKKLRGENQ